MAQKHEVKRRNLTLKKIVNAQKVDRFIEASSIAGFATLTRYKFLSS